MLSFLHTPPSSPSSKMETSNKLTFPSVHISTRQPMSSLSPQYIPINRESLAVPSPDSDDCCRKKRRLDDGSSNIVKVDSQSEEDRFKECSNLFDNPEDVLQALCLLRNRKNVNIKEYSHEGTFIPNVLLALSQTPIISSTASKSPSSTETITSTNLSSSTKLSISSEPALPTVTLVETVPAVIKPTKPKSDCSRPYVCEYCGKQFSNVGNLATHARTHTKEKPYKCEKCDLTFAHTSNLQRHQLVHSGARNNKCPHCAKCFSRSDYLKVHERTHTGEKPYACSIAGCTKRFLDSSSLKKHERTHSGDRPFACHICYKTYTESSKLKIHLQSHAAPKTFDAPTVALSNPFYDSLYPPSFTYPPYQKLYQPPVARPTPTRPSRAAFFHPYNRTVISTPAANLAASSISDSVSRYSAFLPVS